MIRRIFLSIAMLSVVLLSPPNRTHTGSVEPFSEPLLKSKTTATQTIDVMDVPLQTAPPKYAIKVAEQEVPQAEENTPPNLVIPLDTELKEFIYTQCNQDDDMYCLVMSVIHAESEFVINSVSADGHDKGLMQLRDTYYDYWIERYHVSDPKEPHDNLKVGIFLLYEYLEKYEHKNLALMCYNIGETGAKRMWKQGVYSTQYTEKVLSIYENYLAEAKEM